MPPGLRVGSLYPYSLRLTCSECARPLWSATGPSDQFCPPSVWLGPGRTLGDTDQHPRRLVDASALGSPLLSLAAAAGAVVFRLLGTRTTPADTSTSSAVESGLALPKHALNSSDAVLTAVSIVSFVLIGGLLVGVSLVPAAVRPGCRRRRDARRLVRDDRVPEEPPAPPGGDPRPLGHGFPSGHSTVALALGLSFVLVTPDRRKLVVAAAAALYAALMGRHSSFTRGTFRPTWAAASASQPPGRPARHSSREGRSSAGFPAVSSPPLSLLSSSPRRSRCTCGPVSVSALTSPGRLCAAAAGIALIAAVCCAAFAFANTRKN